MCIIKVCTWSFFKKIQLFPAPISNTSSFNLRTLCWGYFSYFLFHLDVLVSLLENFSGLSRAFYSQWFTIATKTTNYHKNSILGCNKFPQTKHMIRGTLLPGPIHAVFKYYFASNEQPLELLQGEQDSKPGSIPVVKFNWFYMAWANR